MSEYQHRARKRFGQNFLHDAGVIHRILRAIHAKEGERLLYQERSVASDKPTLQFRKYYYDELRGSDVPPPQRPIGGIGLGWRLFLRWLRGLFRR